MTKDINVPCGSTSHQAIKLIQCRHCMSWLHIALVAPLSVPALLGFTHSSSTLNESANHPMHWTRQTILYLSSGCRHENNDSLTQVKKAMWLNQYFYYAPPSEAFAWEHDGHFFVCLFISLSLKMLLTCHFKSSLQSLLFHRPDIILMSQKFVLFYIKRTQNALNCDFSLFKFCFCFFFVFLIAVGPLVTYSTSKCPSSECVTWL